MKYFHICISCQKPTSEDDVNIVIVDEIAGGLDKERQYYCSNCFASITPEKVNKYRKTTKRVKKRARM